MSSALCPFAFMVSRFISAKMCHLSVRGTKYVHVIALHNVEVINPCLALRTMYLSGFFAAKMCHLSVATCQDVSFFGRGTKYVHVIALHIEVTTHV